MTIKIEIKGIEEVQKMLKNASVEKLQEMSKAVDQAGLYLAGEIILSMTRGVRGIPKAFDTGRLAGSIRKMPVGPSLNASVETNVEYAKFVEYGTETKEGKPKMFARPHFRNTLTQETNYIINYLKEKIK